MIAGQYYGLPGEDEREPFRYTACGLDDVYLINGYEIHETSYGRGVSIKNLDGLHKTIGLYLVRYKKTLNGKEIRFLRKQMDLTQSDLGRLLGYSAQQVARWEKDQVSITEPADHLLRALFQEHVGRKMPIRRLLEVLDRTNDQSHNRKIFASTDRGWRCTDAA